MSTSESPTPSPIRVAVVGAAGRMGRETLRALGSDPLFQVVAAIDRQLEGASVRELVGPEGPDITLEAKLGTALDREAVDVLVDFSHHSSAASHTVSATRRNVSPVVGCTGISEKDLAEIRQCCLERSVPGMVVPNFAIGAVLMMHFAKTAARWMPDVEIIELHHDRKEDAPSGTSMLTAEMVQAGRKSAPVRSQTRNMRIEGARGATYHDVPIHSVRLPGFVAHQEVIFGSSGELLSIRHDSLDRASFMQGVKLCVRAVRTLNGLTVGLDKLLLSK